MSARRPQIFIPSSEKKLAQTHGSRYVPKTMDDTSSIPALVARFAWMIGILRDRLAVRGSGRDPLPTPMVMSTYGWLGRTLRRITALLARVQAGDLPRSSRPRPSRARPKDPQSPGESPTGPKPIPEKPAPPIGPVRLSHLPLPRRQGWLLPVLSPQAGQMRQRLGALLAEPDLQQALAAAPTLGRLLRPLARMLGLKLPPCLQLPPRPRAPRVRPPRVRPQPGSAAAPYRDEPSGRILKAWLPGQIRPFKRV
jgi:hypothetical protein